MHAFTHELGLYDEEQHKAAKPALYKYLNRKKWIEQGNQIMTLRAQDNHDNKIAAFEELNRKD